MKRMLGLMGLLWVLLAAPAQAALITFSASLDGAQEFPQSGQAAAGGFGSASLIFDDVTNLLSWTINFNLNTGLATAAHFHGPTNDGDLAGPGIASPIRFSIPNIVEFSSGTAIGSFDLDNLTNPADNPANLLSGLWYINIHTATFPTGELRGQVLPVSEPGVLALFSLGLMLALGLGKHKKPAA